MLRGLALCGILLVNVAAFSVPGDWFYIDWDGSGPIDYGIEVLRLFFIQGKFYTLFAFLFGVGFALQLTRAQTKGTRFAVRFLWRMVLLYLIGALHIVVLWDGDVLAAYAATGMFLLLFLGIKRVLDRVVRKLSRKGRQKAPRWPALVVAGLFLLGPQAAFTGYSFYAFQVYQSKQAGATLTESEQALMKRVESARSPERAKRAAETNRRLAEGSYPDAVQLRIEELPRRLLIPPVWVTFLCLFMIGAYVGRHEFINRAEHLRRGFKRLTMYSIAIGAPLSAMFVWATITGNNQRYPWWESLIMLTKTGAGLAFGLAMVGAVTLAMMTRARRWLLFLAPVGRMALSNYLFQSVVSTFVFYGYGLGLMGKLRAVEQVGYCVALLIVQVLLSRWWLSRYRFGPVEWLWRSLTYLRRQPMRYPAPNSP